MIGTTWKSSPSADTHKSAEPRTNNWRASASVRSEEEDDRSNDNAKNAEEGINAAMKGSSVGIGFGRHRI